MEESNQMEFEIKLSVMGGTEEELDFLTRQFLAQIKELDVNSAKLKSDNAALEGSKGDPVTTGSITIQLLPIVLPGIIALTQAWITRGPGRVVKFKGKGIEFEGSPEDLQQILEILTKGKRKK
jgi:hypothetical protein